MPHLIIEHSANVADVADIRGLVHSLHAAALGTGIAALDALRTRAVSRDVYEIADGHEDNMFIAVTARLGTGRSDEDQKNFIAALMDALDLFLGAAQQTMMLSVEYQEIDPAMRVNKNNLRPIIANR